MRWGRRGRVFGDFARTEKKHELHEASGVLAETCLEFPDQRWIRCMSASPETAFSSISLCYNAAQHHLRNIEHHCASIKVSRNATGTRDITMASTAALSAAAQDRKARLAQLKSLKRKQPDTTEEQQDETAPAATLLENDTADSDTKDVTSKYLSGRNYDRETKGAKLGFENAPQEGKDTLEKKAAQLALETKLQAEAEEKADKPLDLFKLQPKKPNWDLKRDLDRKLEVLNIRTDNAIARLVRERISNQQKAAQARTVVAASTIKGDAEAAGIEGTTLVEATNIRQREDEEEARREREEDEVLLDSTGS